MVGSDAAVQRLDELRATGLQAPRGEIRQAFRVGHPRDHRFEDGPTTGAEGVTNHMGQLDVRILERLVDPERVARDLADQLLAGAGEVAQCLNRRGWYEAA